MLVEQTYIFYLHELLDNTILIDYLKTYDDYNYNLIKDNYITIYKMNMGVFLKRPYLLNEIEYVDDFIKIPEYYLGNFTEDINLKF